MKQSRLVFFQMARSIYHVGDCYRRGRTSGTPSVRDRGANANVNEAVKYCILRHQVYARVVGTEFSGEQEEEEAI
jgi:hypothetical protein